MSVLGHLPRTDPRSFPVEVGVATSGRGHTSSIEISH